MYEKAILARLNATPAVSAIVSGRIYAQAAKQGATLPYVTFARISTNEEPSASLEGGAAQVAWSRIQIDAWAKKYVDAKALDDEIRKALVGFSGTLAGVTLHSVRRIDARDIYEPDTLPPLHRASADYLVCFNL